MRRFLLACGIASSLLYAAMNVFVPMFYAGYSSAHRTVSELSAIGAPTRPMWVVLGITYTLLVAAFGWGVVLSAGPNRSLRVAGWLMAVYGLVGAFWPPMHTREVLAAGGGTLTDTLHIAFTGSVFFVMFAIGYAAAAFGKWFRAYSFATLVVMVGAGYLVSLQAPAIQVNQPTPWIGLWERVVIAAFMLWIMVFARALWREPEAQHETVVDRGRLLAAGH